MSSEGPFGGPFGDPERLNVQGNADQQAEEIRAAMTTLFPEAVALVREAREGFGN